MKRIRLTQGKAAMVDDADYRRLAQFKWYARKDKSGIWRAMRNVTDSDGSRRSVLMHREIFEFEVGDPLVDHNDRNGLNNQRTNLRVASKSGNASNSKVRKDNVYGLKGVGFDKRSRRWRAQIKHGKIIWLGYFKSARAAAVAYDRAAVKYHGEFARINYPRALNV